MTRFLADRTVMKAFPQYSISLIAVSICLADCPESAFEGDM